MKSAWNLKAKTCLITGVTQGIGRVAARELASLSDKPRLVLVARDARRGQALVQEIKASSGNQDIELLVGDLSVQADIRRVASEFLARHERLHVLLNNAGAVFASRQLTADGHEMTFALNHLGYFLLTELLLALIKKTAIADDNDSKEARIINVASNAHHGVTMNFDDLMHARGYGPYPVYKRSKLANLLHTFELARRLKSEGATTEGGGVTVNCLHPGFVRSGFGHNNNVIFSAILHLGQLFAISAEEGARTMIYLATSPEVSGVTGKYFVKERVARSSRASLDEVAARRLWEASCALTSSV
jgi:NAD(P)-dependent dehydrogenase (short-subunit alcohol dehydrogenase family)